MKKDPRHRSTIATLTRLTTDYLYFHLGHPREDVLGRVALGQIGLRVSRYVAERFGADREAATRTCSREAAGLLGLRSLRGFSAGERLMWERWSPMILALPGLSRWTAARKAALIRVVRAKGGRRESDFVRLFNGHRPLRSALLRLAEDGNGDEP